MSEGRKLVYAFDEGSVIFMIYSQGGALTANIIIDGTVHSKDVEVMFQFSVANLGSLLSDMLDSETLNIDMQGSKLLFSVKHPYEPITLFTKIRREDTLQLSDEESEPPLMKELLISEENMWKCAVQNCREREALVESSLDFKTTMKDTRLAAMDALQLGGCCEITGKRRKHVFSKDMQLQTVKPASISINYTSLRVLEAITETAVKEKSDQNKISLQGETSKFALSTRYEKAKIQSQIDTLKANNTAKLKQLICEEEIAKESQRNTSKCFAADLKCFLEKSERSEMYEVEAHLQNEKKAFEMRMFDIEEKKAKIEIDVNSEITEHRRQVELLESQATHQKQLLDLKTRNERVIVEKELENIKKISARRREEKERLKREALEQEVYLSRVREREAAQRAADLKAASEKACNIF